MFCFTSHDELISFFYYIIKTPINSHMPKIADGYVPLSAGNLLIFITTLFIYLSLYGKTTKNTLFVVFLNLARAEGLFCNRRLGIAPKNVPGDIRLLTEKL